MLVLGTLICLFAYPSNALLVASSLDSRKSSSLLTRLGIVGDIENNHVSRKIQNKGRREFISSCIITNVLSSSIMSKSWAEESIAERAARITAQISEKENSVDTTKVEPVDPNAKTIYDFSLPVNGVEIPISELVGSPRAILIVNIKQDDPLARKNIPGLMSLVSKYGAKEGGLSVISVPSDQGFYEPDTSILIQMKLRSEYGYGINPSTILTDKINLLGTGGNPCMKWLQANCRTPQGLGKIQSNFEKFLIDGQTGVPLRRYPRRYLPSQMTNDIEALTIKQKSALPLPSVEYREAWRDFVKEAATETYRFQKGLNYYDQ